MDHRYIDRGGDRAAAERNLNTLETRRRVMVAALYLPNGAIFASFVRPGEAPPPLLSPRDGVSAHGEHVELAQPVERNGERLGTIYLRARFDVLGRIEAYA